MIENKSSCIFCGQVNEAGIYLWDKMICSNCVTQLLKLQIEDPTYEYYKDKIKAIWGDSTDLYRLLEDLG